MPEFVYSSRRISRQAMRPLEISVWLGLAAMVGFLLLATFNPTVKKFLDSGHQAVFPFILVAMYLLFLIPSRRFYRYQRFTAIDLATTRKGLTYRDAAGEKILSWRDFTSARVLLDADPRRGTWVRKIFLHFPKGRIVLENDPPTHALEGVDELAREVAERVKSVTWLFHWYHPLCPLCKAELVHGRGCDGCGHSVRYVNKLLRPWEILREEGVYLFLILLVAGPVFHPFLLLWLGFVLMGPVFRHRAPSLVPFALEPAEAPAEPTGREKTAPSPTTALLLLASLLTATLLARPVALRAAPAPPDAADRTYMPLAVGNTWVYHSNYGRISQKVTRKELVNGVDCFVLESWVGSEPQSTQAEYFAYLPDGLKVLKRTHKGSDFFLDTPEPMLEYPLVPGRRWTWQGGADQGSVFEAFSLHAPVPLKALGGVLTALPLYMSGRSADGAEVMAKRWYARGIGMVREVSMLKKSSQVTRVEADLVHYSVREEGVPGATPRSPAP